MVESPFEIVVTSDVSAVIPGCLAYPRTLTVKVLHRYLKASWLFFCSSSRSLRNGGLDIVEADIDGRVTSPSSWCHFQPTLALKQFYSLSCFRDVGFRCLLVMVTSGE